MYYPGLVELPHAGAPINTTVHADLLRKNLHSSVLWFSHTWSGWHEQMRIAVAMDSDFVLRHAITHQFGLHGLCAADGKTQVIGKVS